MRKLILLSLLLAAPAFAQDDVGPATASHSPTPIPTPTAAGLPNCEDTTGLVSCREKRDPATVLNQRLDALDKGAAQAIGALNQRVEQLSQRVSALEAKKK